VVVIDTVLGNVSDPEWADRLAASEVDVLEIDQWEAQKSRFRKTTAKGVEVAVSVDRGTYIRDGDVLLWDAQARSALVARVEVRGRRCGRPGALAHAREQCGHRRRDGTGVGTPATAPPSARGDRCSCTWIAAQGRFHARRRGMRASKRQAALHYSRGCCSSATR